MLPGQAVHSRALKSQTKSEAAMGAIP